MTRSTSAVVRRNRRRRRSAAAERRGRGVDPGATSRDVETVRAPFAWFDACDRPGLAVRPRDEPPRAPPEPLPPRPPAGADVVRRRADDEEAPDARPEPAPERFGAGFAAGLRPEVDAGDLVAAELFFVEADPLAGRAGAVPDDAREPDPFDPPDVPPDPRAAVDRPPERPGAAFDDEVRGADRAAGFPPRGVAPRPRSFDAATTPPTDSSLPCRRSRYVGPPLP
ncbi:hypothetical protein [Isoptericola aurantiacus]|uniref:hypothetical protein n=1 Tax=Isoptericola aurantiacus TaxID=3377839 RepID=UPI00383A23BA